MMVTHGDSITRLHRQDEPKEVVGAHEEEIEKVPCIQGGGNCRDEAEGRDQTLRQAARAAMAGADWVELRLDRWPPEGDLESLISAIRLPVLVAIRTPEDGGAFRGSLAERRELFGRALAAGAAGIDLEHWETWTPSVGRNRLRLMIRSYHNFTGVPQDLAAIHDKLFAQQGTVGKIAVTAHDLAQAAPVLELMAGTDQTFAPTVAFAMGQDAWPTRVLACVFGAPLVYGSVAAGCETAPRRHQDPTGSIRRSVERSGLQAIAHPAASPSRIRPST